LGQNAQKQDIREKPATGTIQEAARKIADQIEGFKITKESRTVEKFNDKKYIEGCIDGLEHALHILENTV
jgi:hypothetical protein